MFYNTDISLSGFPDGFNNYILMLINVEALILYSQRNDTKCSYLKKVLKYLYTTFVSYSYILNI